MICMHRFCLELLATRTGFAASPYVVLKKRAIEVNILLYMWYLFATRRGYVASPYIVLLGTLGFSLNIDMFLYILDLPPPAEHLLHLLIRNLEISVL